MKNDFRQKLHLEPKNGWINDPNGLCYFKGEYHVYYQYSPDSPTGSGKKCWGHWKSHDLINWRSMGIVLFPDTPDDKDGVYSGCGFVKDDTLYLFYTGNVKEDGDHDYITSGRGANVILVTTKNGQDMSAKKVLLRNSDYPEECSCHVRDPKVWEEDGRYHMVLGARTLQDKGCVLHYVSDDLENWSFFEKYTADDMGYMWECPDEFSVDGHRFLSISPQGLAHEKFDNQNVYSSGYYCMENCVFADFIEWDKGFDFYAPQSFETPDGRRILLGWEGIGDIPYSNPTAEIGWQHCLTLPRELTVSAKGKLLQNPVRELVLLRKNEAAVNSGDTLKIELPFELNAKASGDIRVRFENVLQLVHQNGEFRLEFLSDSASGGRDVRYADILEIGDIRIIADKASVEVYINGGETVMSARMYPEDTEITLSAEGINGTVYELDGIEVMSDE